MICSTSFGVWCCSTLNKCTFNWKVLVPPSCLFQRLRYSQCETFYYLNHTTQESSYIGYSGAVTRINRMNSISFAEGCLLRIHLAGPDCSEGTEGTVSVLCRYVECTEFQAERMLFYAKTWRSSQEEHVLFYAETLRSSRRSCVCSTEFHSCPSSCGSVEFWVDLSSYDIYGCVCDNGKGS